MTKLKNDSNEEIEQKKKSSTRLKKILKEKGIDQKQLSKLTDIGEYKISQLCTGKSKNLQMSTALKICKALKCTIDKAFGDLPINEENED